MLLEIKDLRVRAENKDILKGLTLTVNPGEVHAIMGPNGSGKSTLARALSGHPGYEVTRRLGHVQRARTCSRWSPKSAPARACSWRSSTRSRSPGINNTYFLKAALNAVRKSPRPAGARCGRVHAARAREVEAARDGSGDAQAVGQRGVLGRREEAQRDLPDGRARAAPRHPRRDGLGPRHRRAEDRLERRQCAPQSGIAP